MALPEYKGAIVMDANGQEVEIVSMSVTKRTGTKPVKTMNRRRTIAGFARGIQEYEIRATVAIPLEGDLPWEGMEGIKITEFPVSDDGKRTSYLNCYVTEIGEEYSVDNEARRDISLFAERMVTE